MYVFISSKVENDLSGLCNLHIYLWTIHGSGINCICNLEVKLKPIDISNLRLHEIQKQDSSKGFITAWHQNCPFQIFCERSLKTGRPGFAIQDMKIAFDEKVCEITCILIIIIIIMTINYLFLFNSLILRIFHARIESNLKLRDFE